MFELLNSPSVQILTMPLAIAAMNYYIRKYQIARIQDQYAKVVEMQERKTNALTCELFAVISTL